MTVGAVTNLAEQVTATVRERTGGRLREAAVVVAEGVVTVRGVAPSFYLKQLALEATRAALRGFPFTFQLEIAVHAN
jgi:hypothetical protein